MNTYVQSIDESKREEWRNFYANSRHPEDAIKNNLINRTHKFCPGFKYLIDFEWGTANEGKGDLILGSENGVYLIIETKSLHTGSGRTAQASRHNARHRVREQALRYKELATARFGVGATVIGAIFTNEDYKVHFLDDYDERIARRVAKESQSLDFMDWAGSILIICIALSSYFYEDSIYIYIHIDPFLFSIYYLLSVFFSMIILNCFGKSQRYYIYYFAIPIMIILILAIFALMFIMIRHTIPRLEKNRFDNVYRHVLYMMYWQVVLFALSSPFFILNGMIKESVTIFIAVLLIYLFA